MRRLTTIEALATHSRGRPRLPAVLSEAETTLKAAQDKAAEAAAMDAGARSRTTELLDQLTPAQQQVRRQAVEYLKQRAAPGPAAQMRPPSSPKPKPRKP